MRVASRMRPEMRLAGSRRVLRWEHDGLLVDTFTLSVDGTEYELGALTPLIGTTYETYLPEAVMNGAHDVIVYAVNENGRSESIEVSITW